MSMLFGLIAGKLELTYTQPYYYESRNSLRLYASTDFFGEKIIWCVCLQLESAGKPRVELEGTGAIDGSLRCRCSVFL